jgi:hypothetical protein
MIRYWVFVLFLLHLAFAETCAEQFPQALVYDGIEDVVGLLYFQEAEGNSKRSEFVFSGGVCLDGKAGWQLITERVEVTPLPEAQAEKVSVRFEGWQLQANFLQASPAGLTMQGITFFGEGIQGVAQVASYDFLTEEIKLINASTTGENLQITGQEATLVDGQVFFSGIEATTCNCESNPYYKLNAEQATLELDTQNLLIERGTLTLFGLPLQLNQLEVSPESLQNFSFPVVIEYVPDDSDKKGTGLGIRVPFLRVSKELNLELGITGLDDTYPLGGILLTHYKDSITSFDVGYAAEGFQADVNVRQPLSATTTAIFSVRNRDWESQDYLHEGLLGLETSSFVPLSGSKLNYYVTGFSAISSQTLNDTPFHDGRLGLESTLSYALPANPLGNVDVNLKTNATYYPSHHHLQWGVRFNPTWQTQWGPFALSLGYLQQWTNSASPFSTKLDRLEPKSQLALNTSLKGPLSNTITGEATFSVRYDFLEAESNFAEGFTALGFSSKLTWSYQEVNFSPYIIGELAPALNLELENDAYLETGMDAVAPRWEAGFAVRFDTQFKLSKLEGRTAFPIDINDISLKPYIAIDFIPTLQALDFPRISGHGLELTWHSCCGTISVGYRQQENSFKTLIGFTLE